MRGPGVCSASDPEPHRRREPAFRSIPQVHFGTLDTVVAHYEGRSNRDWSLDRLSPDLVDRLTKAITCFEAHVESMEGKFKLGQNRNDDDLRGVVEGLSSTNHDPLRDLTLALLPNDM